MLDTSTGEVVKRTLKLGGNNVREFCSSLARPARIGIEATGSMHRFLNLMQELGIECLVGHTTEIRAAEPRKQKHGHLLLSLLENGAFRPAACLRKKQLILRGPSWV